ncbi:MAG: hypothetical protein Q9217_000787 [Psora testacea]
MVLITVWALLNAAGALGQEANPTSNPLNDFIDGVQSGAGVINSALSAQSSSSPISNPSSSSTTPTAAPATSSVAATPHHGLSNGAKIGIIVGCVVGALLIIGLLAGICCCLMLRKRRRRRTGTPVADEEIKSWKSKPTNPGRNYSPVGPHGRTPSMEQRPTVPLMAAGAIPHGSHSQAPSLSQHPAMRDQNENPFADHVSGTHYAPHNSHHGLEAAAVGASAAGAAGYGMHKHSQAGGHQPISHAEPIAQNQHHGLPPGVAAATVGGATGHGTHNPNIGASYPVSNSHPTLDKHNGLNFHPGVGSNDGLNTVPSANNSAANSPNGLNGAAAGAPGVAGSGAQHQEGANRLRSESRSRSRSHPRPGSGGLPTHNDSNRPPTPFGLSGIGQPYEDMHVHVLQSEAPSGELRRSLQNRENPPLAAGLYDGSDHAKYRNSSGNATPPQVPSRSPHREKRASIFADNSYESSLSNGTSTSSNSGGEKYQQTTDPYRPAQPNRAAVAPWEQHQTRYSNTPPTSATMSPPPVPWQTNDYAQQRRHSHSPRQSHGSNISTDANGRRSSRSPATSINGQPRRLRFEDLQPGNGNGGYSAFNQRDSYDGYEHARWSQGVGEAL